jgi:hypothetical protein
MNWKPNTRQDTPGPPTADMRKAAFKQRVRYWAGELEVDFSGIAMRAMRSKWASCSTAGYLNFNTELLDLESDLWDYVIVHELLHFFVSNHGRVWKMLMRAHLGDYENMKSRLAKQANKGM